jgi:Fe2+ transport system protein FeoA
MCEGAFMLEESRIKPGIKAKVCGIKNDFLAGGKQLRQQFLSMGLTPGTEFEVVGCAPLGDPIQIKVRGFLLGLRQFEMDALQFEVL